YYRQYTNAAWNSSDNGGIRPVKRRSATAEGDAKTSEKIESDAARFYSGADAVVHGGDTHLVFGTDRIWYSRDWGRSWVTLPTAKDPRAGDNPDLRQDVRDPTDPKGEFSDTVPTFLCCTSTYHG